MSENNSIKKGSNKELSPPLINKINNGEIDCISVVNPRVYIHECKIQIDGITKYLEDHEFYFDGTLGEKDNTFDIYKITLSP